MSSAYKSRRQKKISQRQEEKAAADLGGTVVGRVGGRADVRLKGKIRLECKYTEHHTYVLKYADLEKLWLQAVKGGLEQPVFQVGFKIMGSNLLTKFAIQPAHLGIDDNGWARMTAKAESVRLSLEELRTNCREFCGVLLTFEKLNKRYYIITWDKYLEENSDNDPDQQHR